MLKNILTNVKLSIMIQIEQKLIKQRAFSKSVKRKGEDGYGGKAKT